MAQRVRGRQDPERKKERWPREGRGRQDPGREKERWPRG
jgi:hypothetical protein